MPPKRKADNASISPVGSLLAGLLFLSSALGGLWLELRATQGYDASRPYNWRIESMSDLGVPYRQVHPLKHYNVMSWRAQTMNLGLLWTGAGFALANMVLLFARTEKRQRSSTRTLVLVLFAAGAGLMAAVHGGPREKHWKTAGWHWTGFALMTLAGNLNSIFVGVRPRALPGWAEGSVYRIVSVLLGVTGVVSFVKFNFGLGQWNYLTELGLWQRAALYPIAAWQIITGLGLVVTSMMPGSKSKQG